MVEAWRPFDAFGGKTVSPLVAPEINDIQNRLDHLRHRVDHTKETVAVPPAVLAQVVQDLERLIEETRAPRGEETNELAWRAYHGRRYGPLLNALAAVHEKAVAEVIRRKVPERSLSVSDALAPRAEGAEAVMVKKIEKKAKVERMTVEKEHELGRGTFGWSSGERVSDRYGCVSVYTATDGSALDHGLVKKLLGKRGRLVVVVEETRESGHIGDFFRGLSPRTPKKGARIVLCEEPGTLFSERHVGFEHVGIKPDMKRDNDWLNPRALYDAHAQIVRLIFEEMS